MIELKHVSKAFTLHNQGSAVIEVINDVSFAVGRPAICVALTGASGAGKSTLMRMIYGNYSTNLVKFLLTIWTLCKPSPRNNHIAPRCAGYVSQFLRVVPRVRPWMWWQSLCAY